VPAGSDAELQEDLVQVVLDRLAADEQLVCNLLIGCRVVYAVFDLLDELAPLDTDTVELHRRMRCAFMKLERLERPRPDVLVIKNHLHWRYLAEKEFQPPRRRGPRGRHIN
jgi:hypothetical protein